MGASWKITAMADVDAEPGAWEALAARGPCSRFALLEGHELVIYRREADGVHRLRHAPPRLRERLARLRFPDLGYDVRERLFDGYDLVLPLLDEDGARSLPALGFPCATCAGDARTLLDLSAPLAEITGADSEEARVAARAVEAAAAFCVRYGTMLRFFY